MLGNASRTNLLFGSKSNSEWPKPDVALALNGMQLGDMPWMLNRNQMMNLLKQPPYYRKPVAISYSLYAMGHDVGSLVNQLSRLRQSRYDDEWFDRRSTSHHGRCHYS